MIKGGGYLRRCPALYIIIDAAPSKLTVYTVRGRIPVVWFVLPR